MISDGCGCIGIRSEAKFRANTNYPPYVDEEMVLIDTTHSTDTSLQATSGPHFKLVLISHFNN